MSLGSFLPSFVLPFGRRAQGLRLQARGLLQERETFRPMLTTLSFLQGTGSWSFGQLAQDVLSLGGGVQSGRRSGSRSDPRPLDRVACGTVVGPPGRAGLRSGRWPALEA